MNKTASNKNQIMKDYRRQIEIKAYMPVVEIEWACTQAVKKHIQQEVWHHPNDLIHFGLYEAIYSRFPQ